MSAAMQTFLGYTLAFGLAVASAGVRAEATSPWLDLQDAQVRLLAASEGLDTAGTATLGVHIRLNPGWKTYWREPGEAGLPPRLSLAQARNVATAAIAFPVPQRFVAFGFTQLGYETEVVLPIRLEAADPAQPVGGTLAIDFMVCELICVPMHADFALDLPPRRPAATAAAPLIGNALRRVPPPAGQAHLRVIRAALDGKLLRIEAVADAPFQAPDLFVEADGKVGFGLPAVELSDEGRRAVLTLPVSGDLAGHAIRLTLVDGERAVEQVLVISP
jgi:suppressor for copper-sensitivity B